MSMEPWEKQKEAKYRDHDLPFEDLVERDVDTIRGNAVRLFVDTKDGDQVTLIVKSFMQFLTSKGYRIVNTNELWKRELDENMNPINVLYDPYGRVVKKEKA